MSSNDGRSDMGNPLDLAMPEKSSVSISGPTQLIMPRPNAFAKLNRAKFHLAELERRVSDFYASEPYQTWIYEDAGWHHYRFREVQQIPDDINLIAGDAIHNARAALDQMVATFVEKGGGNVDRAYFPMPKDNTGIVGKIADKSPKATARARRFIYLLKPYKGGNAKLWLLHSLDLADKHRQVIPVGSANIRVTKTPSEKIWGTFDGKIPFIQLSNSSGRFVRDGDIFHAAPAFDKDLMDTKVSVDVCLGNVDGLHAGPVVSTISELIRYTEKILKLAEKLRLL